MKRPSWQVMLGLTLIALAGALYLIHFLLFRDAHHIFIFLPQFHKSFPIPIPRRPHLHIFVKHFWI